MMDNNNNSIQSFEMKFYEDLLISDEAFKWIKKFNYKIKYHQNIQNM